MNRLIALSHWLIGLGKELVLPCPPDPVDSFSGEHFEIKCTEFIEQLRIMNQ